MCSKCGPHYRIQGQTSECRAFLFIFGKKAKGFVSKRASHNTLGHLKVDTQWSQKHDQEHLQIRNNE